MKYKPNARSAIKLNQRIDKTVCQTHVLSLLHFLECRYFNDL